MTLYELIRQVSEIITPQSNAFYQYILFTSDNNGGFLRTRYRWSEKTLEDRRLQDGYKSVLIACRKEIHAEDLVNKKDTRLKIQFHYEYPNAAFEDADWDVQMGYCYIYLFNLDTKDFIMEYRDERI